MRRLLLRALLALLALTVLLTLVTATVFVWLRGGTPPLPGKSAVASLEQVELGGTRQWILVRGHDVSNPVVLFLHGGPGMPNMYLAHAFQRPLERDFVVVHWDRRGAGKSYDAAREGESLTVSGTLTETWQLSEILRRRFDQERIYLVGHSWGSYLGLLAVRERPELYAAFIGTGQMAGTQEQVREARREFLERVARETGDAELASRLESPGFAATEDDLFRHGGELYGAKSFWPLLGTGLLAPEYALGDVFNVKRGADLVLQRMQHDVMPKPLEGEIPTFEVPIVFFLGRHDYNTPSQLAADYLARVQAPLTQVVWFEKSAHFPFFAEPDRFHQEMVKLDRVVRAHWAGVAP